MTKLVRHPHNTNEDMLGGQSFKLLQSLKKFYVQDFRHLKLVKRFRLKECNFTPRNHHFQNLKLSLVNLTLHLPQVTKKEFHYNINQISVENKGNINLGIIS